MIPSLLPHNSGIQDQASRPFLVSPNSEVVDWLAEFGLTVKHCCQPSDEAATPSAHAGRSKRQQEFARGRSCAHRLLRALGEPGTVGVNKDRSPNWPTGFVGSISHSDRWTWAAVAREADMVSIGIDTECIVTDTTRQEIENEIATAAEWELAAATGLGPQQRFSVVFSAKEAFYKCCYPLNRKYFGFEHAVVVSASTDCIRIQQRESSPSFGEGPASLDVHFFTDNKDVFTITRMEQK